MTTSTITSCCRSCSQVVNDYKNDDKLKVCAKVGKTSWGTHDVMPTMAKYHGGW